ncbi:aminoglycoside adenylyltransferase domain-containing protein [Exiguobacterium chiriqhucha]|uniref:aminoglycoside adenylyltransferase domain-containing protein n=1 Tax=Exiguobacterium chiriqhucha TaxID=1385984 RepID=UPI0006901B1A|nr:aminoglycoside adenylyltransferase domain-containing protein [Exiguobacterium chiriqhucha]
MNRDALADFPDETSPFIEQFVRDLADVTDAIQHAYVHGSVTMGGFHPRQSDVDLLFVSDRDLSDEERLGLMRLCLATSTQPYPLELTVMTERALQEWVHPSPFEFHYSEQWRMRLEEMSIDELLHEQREMTDSDLSAHVKVIMERGCVLFGTPMHELLVGFEEAHYIQAIKDDALDCLSSLDNHPVYSVLNLVRVMAYETDGRVLAKREVLEWAKRQSIPTDLLHVIQKAAAAYAGEDSTFSRSELIDFYIFANERLFPYEEMDELED